MPTVDELLTEHPHQMKDTNSYFLIDPHTRQITNTAEETILMQYDHDSTIYTFELPRYIDNHDMLLCNLVRVHFNNVSTRGLGVHLNPNDSDTVLCTWLISRNATQYEGTLGFHVQYVCKDEITGEFLYEWSSDEYSPIEIRRTRNNSESAVVENADAIEAIRQELVGAGDSIIADIEMVGDTTLAGIEAKAAQTIDSIPDDYTEVANMADTALRKKADAVMVTESGGHIVLDDSSDNNLVELNVYGTTAQAKTTGANKFNHTPVNGRTHNGVTFTKNSDGSFTLSGTATEQAYTSLVMIDLAPGTYYVSDDVLDSLKSSVHFYVGVAKPDSAFSDLARTSITVEEGDTVRSYINVAAGTVVNLTIHPMINLGTSALPWEPYTGGIASPNPDYTQALDDTVNPTVSIHSKNLLQVTLDTYTANGITATFNEDGSVTINGTSTGEYYFLFDHKNPVPAHGVELIASLENANGMCSMVVGYIKSDNSFVNSVATCVDEEVRFTYPDDAVQTRTFIAIVAGKTFDNHVIKPMIRVAESNNVHESSVAKQTINPQHTLRGIPVNQNGNYTDENGQQWICDEIDYVRGKFIQRVGVHELDGSENISRGYRELYGNYKYQIVPNTLVPAMNNLKGFCNHFDYNAHPIGTNEVDNSISVFNTGHIYVRCDKYENVEDFKAFLAEEDALGNTLTIYFPLATPIETDLTLSEIAEFKALTTHATNTTIFNDEKANMAVEYVADLEKWLLKNVSYKKRKFDLVLTEANWVESNDGRYYTQVLDIDARPNSQFNLHPTAQQQVDLILDGIAMFLSNNNGVVTAYSIAGTPGKNITIPATEEVVVYV